MQAGALPAERNLRPAPGSGNNVVIYADGRIYWLEFQHRPDYAKPAAARDPRVRRALYYAIDKDGVIQVEVAGLGPQADSWIRPTDPDRPQFRAAIPDWSFDVASAQQQLAEAGWRRGPDGVMVSSASGERLDLELRVTGVAGHVRAMSVIGDGWRQAGAAVTETVIPTALNSDGEYRSTFGFSSLTGNWADIEWEPSYFLCATMARPATRWAGAGNRAGYCNPALDPAVERLQVTIPDRERLPQRVELMRQILATEYAILPLYWQVQPIVFGKNVSGFGVLESSPQGVARTTWNALLWDKQIR